MKKMGILHESVYTFFRHFGCIEVSGVSVQVSGKRNVKTVLFSRRMPQT